MCACNGKRKLAIKNSVYFKLSFSFCTGTKCVNLSMTFQKSEFAYIREFSYFIIATEFYH